MGILMMIKYDIRKRKSQAAVIFLLSFLITLLISTSVSVLWQSQEQYDEAAARMHLPEVINIFNKGQHSDADEVTKNLQKQPETEEVMKEKGEYINYHVGTMIEIPRAALTADQIAEEAEFFSFGTNDLTQMTFGFSRDDAGKFLGSYYENKIYESDPFAKLDQEGVGQLIKMAAEKGRATKPTLKMGICGEHGGDPSSVEFCHKVGLNYVSCSPFRVPIARLAAAQAALNNK